MALPLSARPYDWLFLAYFIVHLPVSIGVDTQILFDRSYFPSFLVNALDGWVKDADDQLTGNPPLWYQTFVAIEVLFHLPYFVLAIWAFAKGREWIRLPSIMYATEVITTMVPIMCESWQRSHAPLATKLKLQSVLAIWCLLPILLIARVWGAGVFEEKKSNKAGAKKKQ